MINQEQLFQKSNKYRHKYTISDLKAIGDHVIVRDMSFAERTLSSGIIMVNDDGKTTGIRPRWAKVFAVGPDQTDVKKDQWILVEHGRWSRGLEVEIGEETITIRRVDPNCIIFVSDDKPSDDDIQSTSVYAEAKTRG